MSNNNYVSNTEPNLPSSVKKTLSQAIAGIELQAAHIADGLAPEDEMGSHLESLIRITGATRGNKQIALKQNMKKAFSLVDHQIRFEPYRGLAGSLDKVLKIDIGALNKATLNEFKTGWAHIPTGVIGADIPDSLVLNRSRLNDVLVPQRPYKGLRFHLSEVKALDETGSGWFGEIGQDEIYCGAVAVDENGETSSGGLFKVGNFDDGTVRNYPYPGRRLQRFNLREAGDSFPKIYTMAISLIEHDSGDLAAWFDRFFDLIRDRVIKLLSKAVGFVVGDSLGALGSLVGAAIGWVIGKVSSLVSSWLGDEELGTKTISATINGYSGNWVSSGGPMSAESTRYYRNHGGHYRIKYRWELVS